MNIRKQKAFVRLDNFHALQEDLLADLSGELGNALADLFRMDRAFALGQRLIKSHRHESLEILGPRHKIGLTIGLDQHGVFAVHAEAHKAFFGFTARALGGLRDPFFP